MARFPLNKEDVELQKQLEKLRLHVAESQDWVTAFRSEDVVLSRELEKIGRRVSVALDASKKAMTIGLFGPSQVGKSFMVSMLCNTENRELFIRKPDGNYSADVEWAGENGISFLRYINSDMPGNEFETTGIITRFSSAPSVQPQQAGCFVAKAISHADLASMLMSGFLAECNTENAYSSDDINSMLDGIVETAAPVNEKLRQDFLEAVDGIKVNPELESLSIYAKVLKESRLRSFLNEMSKDPGPAGWKTIASLFWGCGRCPSLDALYSKIFDLLEQIGHAGYVEIPWEAVCRRNRADVLNSVALVDVLNKLFDAPEQKYTVYPRSANGASGPVEMGTSDISALVAELILPVLSSGDLIANADVLDFPGSIAPTSGGAPGVERFSCDENGYQLATRAFRRGKLVRLFDHYCRDRDVTVLLLCADDKDPRANLLPGHVSRWIQTKYPSYPELCPEDQENPALFFVRTKSDKFFQARTAIGSGEDHCPFEQFFKAQKYFFERALDESMHWFSKWGCSAPFNNTFFVFNPDKYQASRIPQELAEVEEHFCGSKSIQTHVANPSEKWQAFSPAFDGPMVTGGGALYLAGQVEQHVRPEIKRREIQQELAASAGALLETMPSYVESDLGMRREQARQLAEGIVQQIMSTQDQGGYGKVLCCLQLPERIAVAAIQESGMCVETVANHWQAHLAGQVDEISPVLGVKEFTVLVEELKRLKVRFAASYFAGAMAPVIQSAGRDAGSRRLAARGICRLWSMLDITLGVTMPRRPDPDIPLLIGDRSRPWDRYMSHWEKNLSHVFVENVDAQDETPPGNEELADIVRKVDAAMSGDFK